MFRKKIKIRTRFAPSPTGSPHIGSIWMALFHWLHARSTGGDFIVRLEDTDQSRLIEGAEETILEALKWYGLDYDEGPDIGGAYGPYKQSERLSIYKQYAKELLEKEAAYYCFCTGLRLKKLREEQQAAHQPPGYDGLCRKLNPAEAKKRTLSEDFVIRLKTPQQGITAFVDLIRGKISFENHLIDDQVLLKSDGWPTYHLAGVIDDHLMEINPVIRGEEWLSSTPKQIIIYKALGWSPPQFAHLPLILGDDKSKLSKRHGSVSALSFREEGYLPEAIINFLALLGWNPKTDQEIFNREDLVKKFNLEQVNKSGAIFNREKLDWFNHQYIQALPADKLLNVAKPYLSPVILSQNVNLLKKALEAIKDRLYHLTEINDQIKLFTEKADYDGSLLVWKKSNPEETKKRLKKLDDLINILPEKDFTEPALEKKITALIKKENLGVGDTLWPMRVALSGQKQSPGPFTIASVVGKLETLSRIRIAIGKL